MKIKKEKNSRILYDNRAINGLNITCHMLLFWEEKLVERVEIKHGTLIDFDKLVTLKTKRLPQ